MTQYLMKDVADSLTIKYYQSIVLSICQPLKVSFVEGCENKTIFNEN
jgi:hypothetical protein